MGSSSSDDFSSLLSPPIWASTHALSQPTRTEKPMNRRIGTTVLSSFSSSSDEDFSDLVLQFSHLEGSDKFGNRICRIVEKYFHGDYRYPSCSYWKIKYVSSLQYLCEDIKKGEVEISEFVQNHDDILEHRTLTDYGIEPDPLHLTEVPAAAYSFGRYEERWTSREFLS